SVFFRLSGGGPDVPLPSHLGQLLRRNPKAFPGQPGDIVPPACPGSSPGPPPGGTCPEHLSREASRRHPDQMPEPPQLAPLDGEPRHTTEKTHFSRLYPGSRSFGHDPKLVTIDEGKNVDRPVNRKLCLLAQLSLHHNGSVQRPLHSRRCTNPPVDLPTGSSDGDPHSPASPYTHRPASPEGSQVNIMGVHTVPGSPNTLHRTVATNTPPSPALQRRLGQASPSLARHQPTAGVPSSPLIGRNPKTATAGVPPSPLMGRRAPSSGHSTPDELGAASRQGSTQPPPTPAFPVSPQLPEKRHMSSGDAERTDNRNLTAASGGSAPNLSGAHTLPDISKSIYDGYPDIRMNVKFVQDTSRFWYKPEISREQAISLLKDREPGAFIIRDSHSFRGAYGLAMKVACPPPTVQQNKKVGDMTNELVRHFLIETSPKGVRLKGCPNEPYFGCLSALVYQHAMTPLALPCKLMIPTKDPNEEALELATPTDPVVELLKQGAACNVLFINSVDMESLTGPQAIAKAISQTLTTNPLPAATTVHFKVSMQGITLTDSQRKIFFRRYYPLNTVTYCDLDPQDRKWVKEGGGSVKIFGFVARKQGSTTDNVSHLFAELEADQPASAIVSFVSNMMKR
uniref:SH2 domain-containing protein n=1 Tax=Fundulus heteroclitus TaxID=8078 RepID=A0A3Q2UKG5_FUNHE